MQNDETLRYIAAAEVFRDSLSEIKLDQQRIRTRQQARFYEFFTGFEHFTGAKMSELLSDIGKLIERECAFVRNPQPAELTDLHMAWDTMHERIIACLVDAAPDHKYDDLQALLDQANGSRFQLGLRLLEDYALLKDAIVDSVVCAHRGDYAGALNCADSVLARLRETTELVKSNLLAIPRH